MIQSANVRRLAVIGCMVWWAIGSVAVAQPAPKAISLDDNAFQECRRYCQVSLTPGNVQTACVRLCSTCASSAPEAQFKLGIDAKCDKKTTFCMWQAGANYAKSQSCEARDGCLKKHQACIVAAAPPPPIPTAAPPQINITSTDLGTAAQQSCQKACLARPKALEAKCTKRCTCTALIFDTGISTKCDEVAQNCMAAVGDKCTDRQQCKKLHTDCLKQETK